MSVHTPLFDTHNQLTQRKALPVSLFDIHSQLTPMRTLPVSLYDIHSQRTPRKTLPVKTTYSLPVILTQDVTANLHTSKHSAIRK